MLIKLFLRPILACGHYLLGHNPIKRGDAFQADNGTTGRYVGYIDGQDWVCWFDNDEAFGRMCEAFDNLVASRARKALVNPSN